MWDTSSVGVWWGPALRADTKNPDCENAIGISFVLILKLNDLAHELSAGANSVGFVGIDVHCGSIACAYSANNVAQNSLSAVGVKLDPNNFLVGNAESFCILGSEVNVALCNDYALFEFNFAAGTDKLAGSRAVKVTGFSYGSGDAD